MEMELDGLGKKWIEEPSKPRYRLQNRKGVWKRGDDRKEGKNGRSPKATFRGKEENLDKTGAAQVKDSVLLEEFYGSKHRVMPTEDGVTGEICLGGAPTLGSNCEVPEKVDSYSKWRMGENAHETFAQKMAELETENMQLKQLTEQLARRIQVLEKRLTGLGWSID